MAAAPAEKKEQEFHAHHKAAGKMKREHRAEAEDN